MSSLYGLSATRLDRYFENHSLELWAIEQDGACKSSAVITSVGEIHNWSGDCIHEGERDDL